MATAEIPAPIRIRQAALSLFAARGYDATGIRDIAEAASIPSSLLYHYSRSKEEILRDLVVDGLARHLESSRRALEFAHSPEEGVRALVAVHVLVPIRNPDMARLMESEFRSLSATSRQAVQKLRIEGDRRWESVLRDGVEAGVFTVPDLRLARRLLRRMCTGVWRWFNPDEDTVEEVVVGMTDHVLAFLRATRDARPVRGGGVLQPEIGQVQDIVDAAHHQEPA